MCALFGKFGVVLSHLQFTLTPLFRSANPTRASYPDLSHGLVDLFLIFLVDRFHSVPVPVRVLLQAPFIKILEARTGLPHRAEHLCPDSHDCRYQTLPSQVVSLIKPVLPEQTVDAYL
ncbi:unnamed protein product [Protopolystoma xenopodis]|uniref:Uncharacterized protein n=1 Tax=Protopolystoma xenopodis TaxID=117903 RepID=A0A3S5CN86_9PLAT|nr:unnamed protein product [Protopolystoma xenopodis]